MYINLYGVKTHNLKNIDVSIPKNKIVVITWISWSWKSSLAFDTLYKEWQYRYIESLSTYLRQFVWIGERWEIEHAEWLAPAIAIEQNKKIWNIRSTVWTLTETEDYLRLLFSKFWDIYCYSCWRKIQSMSIDDILNEIYLNFKDEKIYLINKIERIKEKNDFKKWIEKNRKQVEQDRWYIRYLVNINWSWIEYFYLDEPNIDFYPLDLYLVYDKLTLVDEKIDRLKDDIIKLLTENNKFWIINFRYNNIFYYTDKNFCPNCDIFFPNYTPLHFSPNTQQWACENCHWIWKTLQIDIDKIIDIDSPLIDAVVIFKEDLYFQKILEKLCQKYDINIKEKWYNLPKRFIDILLNWDWEIIKISYWDKYYTINYNGLEKLVLDYYYKWLLKEDFYVFLEEKTCPVCNWKKLKKENLSVKINWYDIWDLQNTRIQELIDIINQFEVNLLSEKPYYKDVLNKVLLPLKERLNLMKDLWLWYLTLSRSIDTLSWWEVQRLRLVRQLWNKLSWIIYVLDEPTIWLDKEEVVEVIRAIKKLKEQWNTIVVVEHNEDFIKEADWIIEVWPWAGDFWWNIVFNGPYEDFLKSDTLTSKYINKKLTVLDGINFEKKEIKKYIEINKARKHNLKNIDVKIPLESFVVVTWPSWAWKTTLLYHILYKFLKDKDNWIQSNIRLSLMKEWYSIKDILNIKVVDSLKWKHYENIALQKFFEYLEVESILWWEEVKNIVYVDQSPIWRTPRSCPATFIWVFDDIRNIFSMTQEAKLLWFTPSFFSFNQKWACSRCQWHWYEKIQLHFLPDTYVICPLCNWKRYKKEILQVKYKWKSIADILEMYIEDVYEFFKDISFIAEKLKLLVDIWLWYLKFWQPAHTLSWWESQRLKLVKYLIKSFKWHTIYFLDEPSVWLHFEDIRKLIKILLKFRERWDTILMIEHDKSFIEIADYVIYLKDWKIL